MRIALLTLAILMFNTLKMKTEGAFPDAVPSHLVCYSKKNLEGEAISVVSNVQNLKNDSGYVHDFNDTISSCSVTGIWILYDLPGFEGQINAIYGEDSSFIPSLSGNISSIRKIESNHKISNELVLFKNPLFQKTTVRNVLSEREFPITCPIVRSAIVKGFADWTFVSELSHGGVAVLVSICLKANRNGAAFFSTLDSKTIGCVKSIKQGCKGRVLDGEAQITDQDETKREDCKCHFKGVKDGNIGCDENGKCSCNVEKHFQGLKCDECYYGYYMKDGECIDCQCTSSGSDGCHTNGHCKCITSFWGRWCNNKVIQLKNFRSGQRKSLRVRCSGPCGRVSLTVKIKDNKIGNLQLKVTGGIDSSCNGKVTNKKKCGGTVHRSSFTIDLTNRGPSRNIIFKIFATHLLLVQ